MNGAPTVTAKMAEALQLIDEAGPLSESNVTDRAALTIYHATARRLLEAGLVIPLGRDDHMRPRFGLSPDGEAFVQARRGASA